MSLTTRRLGSPSPEPSRPGLLEHCTAIPDHWPHAWAADLVTHVCPGRLPLLERLRRRRRGAMVDTGGAQRHPADTQRLMEYWAHGEGAAKIRWGVPGDFDRCVVELGKYVGPGVVKGLCSNLHQRATGARPGHAPGEEMHGEKKRG